MDTNLNTLEMAILELNTLRLNTTDDVTLVVEGHKIEYSKKKLAQHSEYFKIMFEGNFSERDQNTVTMNDVDFESLRICIEMCENKGFIPEKENLLMAVQTACMLQFKELIEIISYQLINNVDVDNCLDVWFFAERLNLMPVYLKAKGLALVKFNTIKSSDALLKLNKEDLHKYMSHVHLVCKEFDVFFAFMSWHSMNANRDAIDVLAYLDFNRLTDNEIADMLKHPDVRRSLELSNVLVNVIKIRIDGNAEDDLAQKLLNCNRRGLWANPIFFEAEADENHKEDDDGQGFWEALNLWLLHEDIFTNVEYKIVRHKQQLYMIRFHHLGGVLRFTMWTYDSVQKYWKKNPTIFAEDDIVDSCFIKNNIYIAGGKINVRKHSLMCVVVFMSRGEIGPNSLFVEIWAGNAKCCNYKDQVFIFYNEINRGYICCPENLTSFQILNLHELNFPKLEGEIAVYSCNDRIFLKDKTRLVQIRIEDDTLHLEKVTALPQDVVNVVCDKSSLCHDTEYSIGRYNNLLIMEAEMIFRDHDGDYRIGKTRYVYDTDCKMLLPNNRTVSGEDKYVNTIENLFAK